MGDRSAQQVTARRPPTVEHGPAGPRSFGDSLEGQPRVAAVEQLLPRGVEDGGLEFGAAASRGVGVPVVKIHLRILSRRPIVAIRYTTDS
ncbi:Uncharacterised protein [Mycobacteroides abscessus subsp. abscessus]|nr:Uncharacterised protein [Mycobacteroides abscessus subsp. abscessus]